MPQPLSPVYHPGIDVRLAYATADNFTGGVVYDYTIALLHRDAAQALYLAADMAQALGLRIALLDAFRSVDAQARLWAFRPDSLYVADPQVGSDHSRGVAVDVTLLDADGNALDMGSAFDAAEPLSHHDNAKVPAAANANRRILLDLMEHAGFHRHPHEWWHYSLPTAQTYPLLEDIDPNTYHEQRRATSYRAER